VTAKMDRRLQRYGQVGYPRLRSFGSPCLAMELVRDVKMTDRGAEQEITNG